jgi:ferredoxin
MPFDPSVLPAMESLPSIQADSPAPDPQASEPQPNSKQTPSQAAPQPKPAVTELDPVTAATYNVNRTKCIGCRLCVSVCSEGAISMVQGKAVIDPDKCSSCGICKDGNNDDYPGCPVEAITAKK